VGQDAAAGAVLLDEPTHGLPYEPQRGVVATQREVFEGTQLGQRHQAPAAAERLDRRAGFGVGIRQPLSRVECRTDPDRERHFIGGQLPLRPFDWLGELPRVLFVQGPHDHDLVVADHREWPQYAPCGARECRRCRSQSELVLERRHRHRDDR
jgi:hypothetical protein